MEKLELKHIAPYLPYGLKVEIERLRYPKGKRIEELTTYNISYFGNDKVWKFKPILRPMSDLEKIYYLDVFVKSALPNSKDFNSGLSKIETKICQKTWGVKIPSRYSDEYIKLRVFKRVCDETKLSHYNFFIRHNFDVFGLIEKGLAIDINTLDHG